MLSLTTDLRNKAESAAVVPQRSLKTSLFDEDWWLDAAAPGQWDRVFVSRDAVVVAEMAIYVRKRWGLTFLEMPPLTRMMSPRLSIPEGKPVTKLVSMMSVMEDLTARLPKHDRFERSLAPGCPSALGFVHAGFAVTHTFTFRSAPGDGPERLLANAHRKSRNVIARAQRECSIEASLDLDRFMRLHVKDFGPTNKVDYQALQRLFAAASSRGQAEILFARLNDEADTAATIIVSDKSASYCWVAARDPEQTSTGANSLIVVEAMRMAYRRGRVLDLDGYVSPQVGLFLAKFGLEPVVRPYVNRSSAVWKALNALSTFRQPHRFDRNYRV